jgi:hypothetical protein
VRQKKEKRQDSSGKKLMNHPIFMIFVKRILWQLAHLVSTSSNPLKYQTALQCIAYNLDDHN